MFQFNLSPRSPLSMTTDPLSQEDEYVAEGLDNAEAVRGIAMLQIPRIIATARGALFRQDIKVNKQGFGVFYCVATYGPTPKGVWTWKARTGGGTFNIKSSLQHIASYTAAGEVAKDHKGAIGRQLDGTVDGVDIVIPSMQIDVTYSHEFGVVTLDYCSKIMDLTGMVNNKPFLRRQPGEVLFLGGDLSDGTETAASAGYAFAVSKNLRNKLIGGITVAEKLGHDYAWIEFKNAPDGNQPVTIPRQIDVCRVYEQVDLAAELGFGG